jgi:hypothetical protein
MEEAVCRDMDPEIFFPLGRETTRQVRFALETCLSCPVVLQCRQYQKDIDAHYGIWGAQWLKESGRIDSQTRADLDDIRDEWVTKAKAFGWTPNILASHIGISWKMAKRWLESAA